MATDPDPPATTNMADDEDAQPDVLLPCTVCGRKFNPRSLDKHVKICERTAAKKRKPFDSAKQRIQGTELAEFLPKQPAAAPEPRRPGPAHAEERHAARRPSNAWKQTRDEFLRAIRAARGDNPTDSSQSQCHNGSQSQSGQHPQKHHPQQHHPQQHHQQQSQTAQQRPSTLSLVTATGAPQRSNEKGQCPTCQRQFGLKSYDRHVAFCRERATRLPASPQTGNNVAKERLDARMKYRAPALKNRRPTNREKYSPGAHKTVLQSPLLARSPMKETAGHASNGGHASSGGHGNAGAPGKSAENASPKLPMLKRPGQVSKESPVTSNGPMKSRPVDRSNRESTSQESLNPPALRQLFASRRLLMLSEVLPSKILHSKKSVSSSSSQKSSARLVPNLPSKEVAVEDASKLEVLEKKTKRRIKFKSRAPRKTKPSEEPEASTPEPPEPSVTRERDFVTWTQIRAGGELLDSIDKEEEPVLSDLTGLSSLDEGNSTNDEFNYSRHTLQLEAQSTVTITEEGAKSEDLDNTFVLLSSRAVESLLIENAESSSIADIQNKPNESDDEHDLSSASTKTFRKSEREITSVEFVDSLDSYPSHQATMDSREAKNLQEVDSGMNGSEMGESEELKKIRENLISRPKKYLSMPNMPDVKAKTNSEIEIINEAKKEEEKIELVQKNETNEPAGFQNRHRISKKKAESQEPSEPTPLQSDCSSRRCATYVIDEADNSGRARQQARTPRTQPSTGSSEEKPKKKRRRLGEKNRARPESSEETFVVYDYYRNEAANFSEVSSARTEDQQVLEFDDDFADENESNASELVKEIDGFFSRHSFSELTPRVRLPELTGARPATRKGRDTRLSVSFAERNEETSISTIELTELPTRGGDRPAPHYEREICTITRLRSSEREDAYLPSIDAHRQHRPRQPPKLRGIIELETPRIATDDDEESRRLPPAARIHCPPIRGASERRSHLRRSFERLPRCDWNSYMHRHPDFSMILRGRIGASSDYNPFLLAEQQLNDLFSDTSDQSSTDGSGIGLPQKPNSSPNFPLSHSSAFVKYTNGSAPTTPTNSSHTVNNNNNNNNTDHNHNPKQSSLPSADKRASVIAPPSGFDDLTSSDLSSDCTETNSVCREQLTSSSTSTANSREHVLGRRVIIDQSQALGGALEFAPRLGRPLGRAASAPRPPERKLSSSSSSAGSELARKPRPRANAGGGSHLSLSSIISSSDAETMRRSNSLFDELLGSLAGDEDDEPADAAPTLPALISSLMRNESSVSLLSSTTASQNGHRGRPRDADNARINCSDDDADLSSPESVKRQECGKLSADSAYSSANDVSLARLKLSKFCHECGFKFPDSAKFCCECGVKRLTL